MALRTYDTPHGQVFSVTTILNIIDKPFLKPWALKMAREKIIEGLSKYGCNINIEKMIPIWCKEADRYAKTAAEIGTKIHNAVEEVFNYHDDLDNYVMSLGDDIINNEYFKGISLSDYVYKFYSIIEDKKIKLIGMEEEVYHSLGFAGKFDFICKYEGELALGDIKTSTKISYENLLQTEAYRRCILEMTGIEIPNRIIIRLDKKDIDDSEFEFIEKKNNKKHWQGFKSALSMFYLKRDAEIKRKSEDFKRLVKVIEKGI